MTNDRNRAGQGANTGAGTRDLPAESADHLVTPNGSIQSAVDGASAGDVIGIDAGTYTEQVVLDEQVTLVGAGKGETTIRSPQSLDAGFTRDDDQFRPVVLVESEGEGTTVKNLTVDGDRQGRGNEAFVGVGSHDAGLFLQDVEVKGVGEASPDGARHGFGVFVYVEDGVKHQAEVKRCEVHDYQRGGVVGDGDGLAIYVEESSVTGSSSTAPVRQNGVQVSDVDRATVVGCTITDNYHAETTLASGVAVINSSDVFLAWNTIERNDVGISAQGTDEAVVRRNNVHSNGMGVLNLGAAQFDATNNWWGAEDGPAASTVGVDEIPDDAGDGPDGSGDAVYNVEWDPYSDERFALYPSVPNNLETQSIDRGATHSYGRNNFR